MFENVCFSIYIYLHLLCVWACMCSHSWKVCACDMGLSRVHSLFPPCRSWDQTQIIMLVGNYFTYLYPLNHPANPWITFFLNQSTSLSPFFLSFFLPFFLSSHLPSFLSYSLPSTENWTQDLTHARQLCLYPQPSYFLFSDLISLSYLDWPRQTLNFHLPVLFSQEDGSFFLK